MKDATVALAALAIGQSCHVDKYSTLVATLIKALSVYLTVRCEIVKLMLTVFASGTTTLVDVEMSDATMLEPATLVATTMAATTRETTTMAATMLGTV